VAEGPILSAEELRVGYGGGYDVLRGVSLTISDVCITGIAGPNGSGKSTFLKAVAGLLRPRAGTVRFFGEDVTALPAYARVHKGLCFVSQGRVVFPFLTVEENLVTAGFTLKDPRLIQERIAEVYEFFPVLKERRRQTAHRLSGGEQTMLALAKALLLRPKLLMLDEPSLGLSPKFVDQIYERIVQIRQTGIPILIVEQNVRKLLTVVDRVCILALGRKQFEGTPSELLSQVDLTATFFGNLEMEAMPKR